MRTPIAAFVVALLLPALAAPPAQAAPIEVKVRIEGKARTLFEGPVLTDVHRVKGATDSKWRRCNGAVGVNSSAPPGVTPTSASSDAMRIIGESFDGIWNSQWEDYFVERWGPDAQETGSFKYWGVIVNNVFTAVGGCQDQLDVGDEVLWVYDAFRDRPRLLLYPGDYSGGALPLTATATLDQPFEVEVDVWTNSGQGPPPAAPTRSTTPYSGAEVAPVTTDGQGFQSVDVESEETELTGADGRASITFTEPGWHRIKAADFDAGVEAVIRSNRLDVCVPEPPASDCAEPPGDALVRSPPPPLPGELDEEPDGNGGGEQAGGGGGQGSAPGAAGPSSTVPPAAVAGRVRLGRPRLDRSRLSRGLVSVSWRVRDAGAGVARWAIAARPLGRKGARWTNRARGNRGSSATIRLAAGAAYALRLTVTDTLGRGASTALGKVRVPN